jgi:hypothetical protein
MIYRRTVSCLLLCLGLIGMARIPVAAQQLSPAEIERIARHLEFSRHVYAPDVSTVPPLGAPGVSARPTIERQIVDSATGFRATVYKYSAPGQQAEYVLAIAGTEEFRQDGLTDIQQLLPVAPVPAQYAHGLSLAREYADVARAEGARFMVTGHSLGGGIAQYVARALDVPAVVFNAAALGPGTRASVRAERGGGAGTDILHVVHRGDPVFENSCRLAGSECFGRVIELAPTSGVDGMLSSASFLGRRPTATELRNDWMARHSLDNLQRSFEVQAGSSALVAIAVQPYLERARQSRTPVLWGSPATAPAVGGVPKQVEYLIEATTDAHRVVVVGSGPDVDRMQHMLTNRLGADNVLRIPQVASALQLRQDTWDFRPEVIVGIRPGAMADSAADEHVLVPVESANRMANALFATAHATHFPLEMGRPREFAPAAIAVSGARSSPRRSAGRDDAVARNPQRPSALGQSDGVLRLGASNLRRHRHVSAW